jgi:dihydropyrimidinase
MHHGSDYTPYEGLSVTGWPVMTILRGKVVAEEGKILGNTGDGKFLRRALSPYAKPTCRAASG